MLEYEVDKFLAEYKISRRSCSIYEYTVLELAGITTKPEMIVAENCNGYMIKGLTRAETDMLVTFLKSHGDKRARYSKFGDEKPNEMHIVITDSRIAEEKILPLLKQRIRELAESQPEKIAEYQKQSKKYFPDNPTHLEALTKQAEKAFMEGKRSDKKIKKAKQDSVKLFPALTNFLKDFKINTHRTDIFEETILKMAGIETQPTRSHFGCGYAPFYGPSLVLAMEPMGTGRIEFNLNGLTTDDAVKLTEYFMAQGDKTARCNDYSAQCDDNYHRFNVDASVVYNKILPQFKEHIQREELLGSKRLDKYRECCKQDFVKKEPTPAPSSVNEASQQRTTGRSSVLGIFKRCFGRGTPQPEAAKDARLLMKR